MSELVFCPGVTLWQLNPLNHALRNDYMSNMAVLAIEVIPKLYSIFGHVAVTEGFVNLASSANDEYRIYRSTGNMITIDKYDVSDVELINGFRKTLEAVDDKIIIDIKKQTVRIYKDPKKDKMILMDNKLIWKE